jgi:GlpG protein
LRQIGTIPSTADPKVFGDYLLALGVTSRAVESRDGWAIWVHNEDLVAKAQQEFEVYQKNPGDPRYIGAEEAAAEARREEERRNREYRRNVRSLSGTWNRPNIRRRPLTAFLVVVCIALFVAGSFSPHLDHLFKDRLTFFSRAEAGHPVDIALGLRDIQHGQVWRLITPIFLHGNTIHLLFNVWAMVVAGTLIETRRGTRTLALLVLLSALASNVGQFLFVIFFDQVLVPWVGISGVVYGLFGYLWMKGRYEPDQGMILHPSSVRLMLLWLLLGFTGLLGGIANGAHLVGLVVGLLFGLARF